jgi:hypothetical protein
MAAKTNAYPLASTSDMRNLRGKVAVGGTIGLVIAIVALISYFVSPYLIDRANFPM